MVDELREGLCPSCDGRGPVGSPCPERICTRRRMHFVPERYLAGKGRDGSEDPDVGTRIGDWLVVKTLGAGGFGKVCLVLQMPIGLKAALKLLHPQDDDALARRLLERFEGEARSLAALSHPNVVRLLHYGVDRGRPFLVMEFVEGARTFKDEVGAAACRGQAFPLQATRRIIGQLIDGLEAAHAAGIVHRDIKPENIMLQRVAGNDAFVRIVDFGLAKDLGEGDETSVAMGTPVYMAPEQIDRHNLGPWTDWYAVGVIVFELLTGRRPFDGRTQREILARKLDPSYDATRLVADRHLPPEALRFLRRALARDPGDRYRTATDFRTGFLRAMEATMDAADGLASSEAAPLPAPTVDVTVDPRRPSSAAPPVASRPRWPLVAGALAGVGAIVAVMLVLMMGGEGEGPEAGRVAGRDEVDAMVSDRASTTMAVDAAAAETPAIEDIVAVKGVEPPPGMVVVAPGTYPVGCQTGDRECWPDEGSGHPFTTAGFAIDRQEVSARAYAACAEAGACPKAGEGPGCDVDDGPARCVTAFGAEAYCRHVERRLPYEAEWETAARGARHPDFPWGDSPATCERAVVALGGSTDARGCGEGRPLAAGSRKADTAWCGAVDLGGNVREWTASTYDAYPGGKIEEGTVGRVVRGGSWLMPPGAVSTAHTRGVEDPGAALPDVGFRCAIEFPRYP
jgi:formylglycine-generating enzyme required for sulfatase activity/tRNA A-37 threonylcarbamoyl transferase component Bud32